MPFMIQTLPEHRVMLVRVTSPTVTGEVPRIYQILEEKLKLRTEYETNHIVMDITGIDRTDVIPAQHYMAIFSKLYEDWHYKRTLVLWIAVNDEYADTVDYMAQKLCLPVYVRSHPASVLDQIDDRYASTATLDDTSSHTESNL